MKLLLDTHAFLWSIEADGRLSKRTSQAFLDPTNELYLSALSYWEICLKQSLGKLNLHENWEKIIDRELTINEIQWLAIEKSHCQNLADLPWLHRDPFDRLLVAQARCEGMAILTADKIIKKYTIRTIW